MKLLFENKESIEDLLTKISSEESIVNFNTDESYIFQGDNFDIMSKLLATKKGFIDLVYIDPPFNTNQIFAVSEERSNAISKSKSGKVAYSDCMEFDEFLKFMYDRFVLLRELLSEKGSLFVHIDCKMGPYFKIMLDEIFGNKCYKNDITRIKSNPKNFDRKAFGNEKDMILFYAKNPDKNIWNDVRESLSEDELTSRFPKVDENGRHYTTVPLHAPGESSPTSPTGMPWRGMLPPEGRHWRTSPAEFDRLDSLNLIEWSKTGNPRIKKFADEHKGKKIQDIWTFKDPQNPLYPTQKNLDMLKLIVKVASNENSYVLDCFAGSGTTMLASAELNRKFIGIDKSEVAISTIEKRLAKYHPNIVK